MLLLGNNLASAGPSYNGVTAISHSPVTPENKDNVTISVTVADDANITRFWGFYCKISPTYLCYTPPLTFTDENGDMTYEATFEVADTAGEVIGYEIIIEYGETVVHFPDERELDYGHQLAEPYEGIFYYVVYVGPITTTPDLLSSTNSDAPACLPAMLLGIATSAVSKRRRS